MKYGFLVDDRDWPAFAEVFTEDAEVDFRIDGVDTSGGSGPFVGVDEIVHQYRDVLTHPYQHMLVSHVIDDVSEDEVIVRSKALLPMAGGRIADVLYKDIVVRTPRGWRIKHKSIKNYNRG